MFIFIPGLMLLGTAKTFPAWPHGKSNMSSAQGYWSLRNELIAKERSLRRDYYPYQNQQPTAKKAEEIVRHIRRKELLTVWSGEHEEIHHLFPGMEFLTARSLIESTKLFKILRKMPKAALLHVHMEATVSAARLLELALEHPAMHIRFTTPVADKSGMPPIEIRPIFDDEHDGTATDLTSHGYKPGAWIPLTKARSTYAHGPQKFDELVIGALTINPNEAYGTHNTVAKIWTKFSACHQFIEGIVRFVPIWEKYVYEFFRSCIDDGIMYTEARISFLQKTMKDEKGQDTITHDKWIEVFDKMLRRIREELGSENNADKYFSAKIIYTTLRWVTTDELELCLEECLTLKQKYPHIIAGFDLVGDENVYIPLKDYVEPLLRFKQRQKELGIEIPFLFHAGETLGDGSAADDNLFDAILLGTKRIGHGYSLAKHPHLMELCKERGIAVEVCPISNEVLRLTSSMPMHPLPVLLNNGIPVALATDNPTTFGNLLSHDLYQVLISSEITGLETLAVMARDSLTYSMLNSEEKREALDVWEKRWKAFVADICIQYSADDVDN